MLDEGAGVLVERGAIRGAFFPGLILRAAVIVTLCAVMGVSDAKAVSSVNVPLDHWSYAAIDKLNGFGLVQSDLQGTRPFTRLEMARIVNEALVRREQLKETPPLVDDLLKKFKKEFSEELGSMGWGSGSLPSNFIKPIDEVQARYVYVDGQPHRFRGFPESKQGIHASEGTPMVYNNEGVVYREHHNLTLQFSTSMRAMDVFSAYFQPILLFRENTRDIQNVDEIDVDLLKGYGKISPWNIEIEAGRDSVWWGQGRHGSFLLTNNATPLDMIKISNPTPTLLPWIFSYLGPFKYTFLLSRLEDDRVIPNPYLGGIRLNFKPHPLFEMGMATTFMFGGKGRPDLGFGDFLDIIGFQGGEANPDFNQLSALDFRLQVPVLRNTQFYLEYGGEDSGGTEFAEELILGDIGFLLGVYVPRLTDDGKTDLRLEFAHNAHRKDKTPGFWYGHQIYRSGYTHDGLIMGHHMGGDAMDFYVRATRYLLDNLVLGVDYEYMERGKTLSPVEETSNELGLDLTIDLWESLCIMARYGFESVENYNLIEDEDQNNHLLMTVFKWQF